MKIKKVNELNISDYTEEELNQYRNSHFKTAKEYILWGEMLNLSYKVLPYYSKLFNSDNLESCINYYEEYLEDIKDMNFGESRTMKKLTGARVIYKYNNIILTEESHKILDLEMLLKSKKYNV